MPVLSANTSLVAISDGVAEVLPAIGAMYGGRVWALVPDSNIATARQRQRFMFTLLARLSPMIRMDSRLGCSIRSSMRYARVYQRLGCKMIDAVCKMVWRFQAAGGRSDRRPSLPFVRRCGDPLNALA